MVNVLINYSDGHYSLRQLTEEEAPKWKAGGRRVALIQESVWRAYNVHLDQCQVWGDLIRGLDEEEG